MHAFNIKSFVCKKLTNCKDSVYKLLDNKLCEYWGNEEASPQFQKQIRTFLEYHNVKNPNLVPIRKFNTQAAQTYFNVYAITRPTGIWINEKIIPPEEPLTTLQLYVLAHESTHFALQSKQIPLLLTLTNSFSYLPRIKALTSILNNVFFLKTFTYLTDNNPDWLKSKRMYLSMLPFLYINLVAVNLSEIITQIAHNLSQELEKEADLGAAQLLCDLGYHYAIEDRIQQCKDNLEKGLNMSQMAPTFKEQIEFLENFLKKWKEKQ